MNLVIQNTSHVWGGNEKSLATLAGGLIDRGHHVIVSCARGEVSERLRDMGIATTHFRPRGIGDFVSGASFALWLRNQNPDCVLITSWNAMPWSAWAAKTAGVKRVVLRQGIVRRAPANGPHGYAVRHWIDRVIVNAPEIKETWIRSLPEFPADHVHVVLNAVTPASNRRDDLRRSLRRMLEIDEGVLTLCAAGILSRRKNFELLFEAIAAVRLADVKVIIVGDGPHRIQLQQTVTKLGLGKAVDFLGARTNGAEIIGGSDLFVLSSDNEGMANVMLEAMAAGVPVIASDISGVRTAIGPQDGRLPAGWIFQPGDATALGATITTVTSAIRNDPSSVEQRTREAAWRIENWFSRDRMLEQSEHILFG